MYMSAEPSPLHDSVLKAYAGENTGIADKLNITGINWVPNCLVKKDIRIW
jgi:hypothetical protein